MLRRILTPLAPALALAASLTACGEKDPTAVPPPPPIAAGASAQGPVPRGGVTGGDLPVGGTLTGAPATSLARLGETVYATGVRWVAPLQGSALALKRDGALALAFGTNGQISDAVPDGRGGVYLAGDFDRIAASRPRSIVHVFATGQVDRRFRPRTRGLVDALALDGSILYAGGSPNGTRADARGVVALNAGTGAPIDGFATDIEAGVTELTLDGRTLYVGGGTAGRRPPEAKRPPAGAPEQTPVAAIDSRSGQRRPAFAPVAPAGTPPTVTALRRFGGALWVGYTRFDGTGVALTRLDPTTGAVEQDTAVRGSVRELVRDGNRVVVVGDLQRREGAGRDYAQALRLEDGGRAPGGFHVAAPRDSGSQPATAFDAVIRGSTLWLGGVRRTDSRVRSRAAYPTNEATTGFVHAYRVGTGKPRSSLRTPVPDGPVNALASVGKRLIVGGDFAAVDVRRQPLAAFDATTGRYAVGVRLPPTRTPRAVAAAAGRLWVLDGRRLLVADPATGAVVKTITLDDATATGLEVAGGRVWVQERSGGGRGIVRLRGYDASTAAPVSARLPLPSADPRVPALLGDGDTLWVGGSFLRDGKDGGPAKLSVLRLDARSGGGSDDLLRYDDGFDPHVDGPVRALLRRDDRLVLGGFFARVGGLRRRNLAAVQATDGAPVSDFEPGSVGAVDGLLRLGTRVLVDGRRAFSATGAPAAASTKGASRVTAAAPGPGETQLVAGALRAYSTVGAGRPHGVILPPRG